MLEIREIEIGKAFGILKFPQGNTKTHIRKNCPARVAKQFLIQPLHENMPFLQYDKSH